VACLGRRFGILTSFAAAEGFISSIPGLFLEYLARVCADDGISGSAVGLRDSAEVRLLFAFWNKSRRAKVEDPLPIERNGRGRRSKRAAGTLRWAHDSLNTIKFARIWSACVSRYAPRSVQRRLRSGVTWSSQPHKRHQAPRNLIRFKAPAGLESRLSGK
jgi:hypothetical protein